MQLRWSFGRHVQGSYEKKTTEIRATVVVEKKMYLTGEKVFEMSGNRLPHRILELEPEERRRKGRPKEKWMDGRNKTYDRLAVDDTSDRDKRRNFIFGEGNPSYSG